MTLLKEQTLAHKLISKGSVAYIAAFLVAPIGYILRVIASRTMDVGDVGLFYSILGFIGLLSAYNDLGLTEALQYFLPKYWIEKKYDHYKTIWIVTFVMQLISGVIIGGAVWLGAEWLGIHYFKSPHVEHILKVFSIYFVAINFLQALSSVYIAFQDVVYDKIVETVRLYSVLICTGLFAIFGTMSLETFSYAWLAGLGIGLSVSVFLFLVKYMKTFTIGNIVLDKKIIKQQLQYAFWVFLGLNAGALLGQVSQQIVIVLLGPVQAGYYSNYLSLFSMYGMVMRPLMSLIFPIATELITKGHDDKIILFVQLLYKYFSVFAISIIGLFVALGTIIGATLYGPDFAYSGTLLQYSAPFIILNILIVINFGFLAGMGKVKERVMILGMAVIANVIITISAIMIFGWGLYGVIAGSAIGWGIMFWRSQILLRKSYPIHYDWQFAGRNMLLIIVLTIILFVIYPYIPRYTTINTMYNVPYLVGLGAVYYCILAGFNYKSITTLRKEIKNLGFLKK